MRKLGDRSTLKAQDLRKRHADSARKSEYLGTCMEDLVERQRKGYEESELILNIFNNIPRLPVHTANLVQLLSSETATSREVSQIAKTDPSLATEILKTVNSSYYGLRRKVSDLHHAVSFLGFNQVHQIVLSGGLRKSMPNTPEFQELHDHSIIIANLVFAICQLKDRNKASAMSTIALLHDIGKSVVLLLKMQNPKLSFLTDMLDQAKLGASLLKRWNIPEDIHRAIEYQNYPDFCPPAKLPDDCRESAAMLFLAHGAFELIAKTPGRVANNPFVGDYMESLGFSGISFEKLVDDHVMVDLQLKIERLPTHVRRFLLADGAGAGTQKRRPAGGPSD